MNQIIRLFVLLLSCGLSAMGSPVLHTTAELRTLSENDARQGQAFDLTAQIIHKTPGITGCSFAIWDETGGLDIKAEDNSESFTYVPGDIVRWRGKTAVTEDREICASATQTVRIGQKPLPDVVNANPRQMPPDDYTFRRIRLKGLVTDAFRDEIDPKNLYFILQADDCMIYAATQDKTLTSTEASGLINAEVEVIGTCMPAHNGHRIFLGPRLQVSEKTDIRVLRAPPADPFSVPQLEDIHHVSAIDIAKLGRRKAVGRVTATWQEQNLMLQTDTGVQLRIELSKGSLPRVGDFVEVVGTPETDLFHLNFTRAQWKYTKPKPATSDIDVQDVSARDLLFNELNERKYKPQHQGRLFRLTGTIRSLPPTDDPFARMMLDCGGNLIPTDTSSCPTALDGLEIGCEVSVVGVCVLDVQNWSAHTVFPRIEGLFIVLRSPADVTVLSRPPWWTPARLMVVIGSLFAALLGIFVWNRILNRLVERRSRELLREQTARVGDKLKVGERTRLAVELHDSLSQTLTGVSFQIDAAEQARQKDPSQIGKYLAVAKQTLQSCREELRNCLWDLRNNALEEDDAEVAIRRTVEPHVGEAVVAIDFKVPRAKLTDNTFHTILCIARELAANAVRHGAARHITICGGIAGNRLTFTVTDDGHGFDPNLRPGSETGHFGLLGVAERIDALGGTLDIQSSPGNGTTVSVTISP